MPCTLSEANIYVEKYHRHHKKVQGHKFSLMAINDGEIVGVAIVGRPVARFLDDGLTLEVTRVATNGYKNACSFLYGACWRATKALGYKKLITYTLSNEQGGSLKAVGWKLIGECGGGTWNCESRPRIDKHPLQKKLRWEKEEG